MKPSEMPRFTVRSQYGRVVAKGLRLSWWPTVGEFVRLPSGDFKIAVVVHVPARGKALLPDVEIYCFIVDEPVPEGTPPPGRPRRRSPPR